MTPDQNLKIKSMIKRLDNLVGEFLKEDEDCANVAMNIYLTHLVDHSLAQMDAMKEKTLGVNVH